ncbi:MAG: hypothetical protein K9W44_12185 [Candidatus Lokiarchaeota archaeon]|nr:hypothetical protein [Candidatus Harpocratesius repetitus]
MTKFDYFRAKRHPKGYIPKNSILNNFCTKHQMYAYETIPLKDRDYEVILGLYCLRYYLDRPVCAWCSQEMFERDPYYVDKVSNFTKETLKREGRTWDEFERAVKYNEEFS